jgi:hypothetical protein
LALGLQAAAFAQTAAGNAAAGTSGAAPNKPPEQTEQEIAEDFYVFGAAIKDACKQLHPKMAAAIEKNWKEIFKDFSPEELAQLDTKAIRERVAAQVKIQKEVTKNPTEAKKFEGTCAAQAEPRGQ